MCCFHPWHAEAARIIKLLRGARAHNVTFMKQPLSVHPIYSVHITMHFSLSMVLNRSRFLSAHCAHIISRIICWTRAPFNDLEHHSSIFTLYLHHSSLCMALNRSKFLFAHCARIISRIIWLDMGPIQRLSSFQREPMCNRWHLGSHC